MREQTFILKLFDFISRTVEDPRGFVEYVAHHLQAFNFFVEFFDSSLRICEDSTCRRYAIITYNPTLEVVFNSRKIARVLRDVAIRYLATRGEKKLVLLYMSIDGKKLVKLTNILKSGAEKFCIVTSRAWNILTAFLAILVAFLSSYLSQNLLLTMLCVIVTSLVMSGLSLVGAYRSSRGIDMTTSRVQIFKICISCSWNTPDSRIKSLLRVLKNFNAITLDSINNITSLSRMFLGNYFKDIKIIPVKLSEIVMEYIRKLGVKILIIHSDSCNAFTLPVFKSIVVTTRLIAILDNDELSAVIGHELGHVINRDFLLCLLAFLLNASLVYVIVRICLTCLSLVYVLLAVFLYIVFTTMIFFALFRYLEVRADKFAERIISSDILALALLKVAWRCLILELERPIMLTLGRIISTHPPVVDRLLRMI
ncbi:MAG: M48 family metalloprotease [Crenarchaeota archaeon]|nr:M48 family metalloprotease [Thermoproteota archaeon]